MAVEGIRGTDKLSAKDVSAKTRETATSPLSPVIPAHTRLTSSQAVSAPFADFVGRCFLRACLYADSLKSWSRKMQAQSDANIESAANLRHHFHLMGWLRPSVAVASCTAIAGCLIPVFAGSNYRGIVPFFFLLVILYVALRFGHVAGIIGTVCAALVFEIFLFEPRLSLTIQNSSARNHLISMVVLGICASQVLGRPKSNSVYSGHDLH